MIKKGKGSFSEKFNETIISMIHKKLSPLHRKKVVGLLFRSMLIWRCVESRLVLFMLRIMILHCRLYLLLIFTT